MREPLTQRPDLDPRPHQLLRQAQGRGVLLRLRLDRGPRPCLRLFQRATGRRRPFPPRLSGLRRWRQPMGFPRKRRSRLPGRWRSRRLLPLRFRRYPKRLRLLRFTGHRGTSPVARKRLPRKRHQPWRFRQNHPLGIGLRPHQSRSWQRRPLNSRNSMTGTPSRHRQTSTMSRPPLRTGVDAGRCKPRRGEPQPPRSSPLSSPPLTWNSPRPRRHRCPVIPCLLSSHRCRPPGPARTGRRLTCLFPILP